MPETKEKRFLARITAIDADKAEESRGSAFMFTQRRMTHKNQPIYSARFTSDPASHSATSCEGGCWMMAVIWRQINPIWFKRHSHKSQYLRWREVEQSLGFTTVIVESTADVSQARNDSEGEAHTRNHRVSSANVDIMLVIPVKNGWHASTSTARQGAHLMLQNMPTGGGNERRLFACWSIEEFLAGQKVGHNPITMRYIKNIPNKEHHRSNQTCSA